MRPHRLTVEAMGPFAHEVSVDFDELVHEGLFLIHGPTGAGKTSLLDALSFALYGEVPGARGDRGLLSDHAAAGSTPKVSLTFSSQGARYQVARQPYHESVKRRGSGTTPRSPTATLVRLDAPAGSAITRPTEVNAEIRRLVGLTARQFQQVILLPQGEFEKVLRGRPEAREELLKTLFHTIGFEDLSEWLADQARTRRSRMTNGMRRLATVAQEALRHAPIVAPEGSAAADPGAAPGQPLFARDAEVGGVPDQAALNRLVARAQDTVRDAAAVLGAADATLTLRRRELEVATAEAAAWDRRSKARVEAQHLHDTQPAIERTRTTVDRARQAEHIRPSVAALAVAESDQAAAQVAASKASARADTLRSLAPLRPGAVDHLTLTSVPAPAEVDTARRALAAELARLAELTDTAERAAEATAAAGDLRLRAEQHRIASSTAAAEATDAQRMLAELAVEHVAAAAAVASLPGLAEAAASTARQATAADELVAVRRRLTDADKSWTVAVAEANAAFATHLDLRARYLNGIAAVLAGTLQPGDACQVCGSLDHPRPAEATVGAVEQSTVDTAEAVTETANAEAERRRAVMERLQRQEAGLVVAAGPGEADPRRAHAIAAEADVFHRDAVGVAEGMAGLGARRTEIEARAAISAATATAETGAADRTEAAALSQDESAQEATARLVDALGPDVKLGAAIDGLRAVDEALAHLADHAGRCDRACQATKGARARVDADVAASPFADRAAAEDALLDAADLRLRSDEVADHDRRRDAVAARLAEADRAGVGDLRPDDATARRAAEVAAVAKDAAVVRHTEVHRAAVDLADRTDEHRRLLAELGPLEADAHLYESVANRCSGRVAPKVSLQRWVLATYLDGICEHANRRLMAMTGGRYQLRVAREVGHAGAKAGLDLRVHDAHTGTERPVTTLSGGETFQASLALALGVADSVEARTGGVRLDALFVDEGFGTLDAESLELAMDELDSLRVGGRMVGVISHVPELRERIRAGIEVTPTPQGSTVHVGEITAG